jgi:hypothetical protein
MYQLEIIKVSTGYTIIMCLSPPLKISPLNRILCARFDVLTVVLIIQAFAVSTGK